VPFPTYDQVRELKDSSDFLEIVTKSVHSVYLNVPVYKQRLRLVLLPFLRDANRRAEEAGQRAYVQVVGIGLGVWAVSAHQARLMVEVYDELLHTLPLPAISDLNFSYFPPKIRDCGGVEDGQILQATISGSKSLTPNSVKIHFSQRDPASKLAEDRLLVAMYAWDGNSMPGNEYWLGMLTASGDPAAACCSGIVQLQNPDINKALRGQKSLIYDDRSEQPSVFLL